MAVSGVFALVGGVLTILMQLYLTYTIMSTGCNYSPFFVLLQFVVSLLFLVFGVLLVVESGAQQGIAYLVVQIVITIVACLNLCFVAFPANFGQDARSAMADVFAQAGRVFGPLTRAVERMLPACVR